MRRGSRWWQAAWGLAGAVGLMSIGAGCHWLPVQRVDPALDPRRLSSPAGRADLETRASTTPADALAARDGVPLPPLPLRPVSDEEALGGPTPILDSALVRAQAFQDAATSATLDTPVPTSERPTEPVETPVSPPRFEPPPPLPDSDPQPPATTEALPVAKPPADAEVVPAQEIAPSPAVAVPAPVESWHTSLERLRALAHTRQAEPGEGESAALWDRRAQVLDWLADEETPSSAEKDKGAPLWRTVMTLLAAASEPDPRAAAVALEAQAPLEVAELRICRKITGFGNFETLDTESCRSDQVVLLYCEMAGLHYESSGDRVRSRLESRLELLPAQGNDPVWKLSLGTAEDLCRRPRRDYYVNYRVALPGPEKLPAGSYRLRVIQKDLLSDHEAERTIPLKIADGK